MKTDLLITATLQLLMWVRLCVCCFSALPVFDVAYLARHALARAVQAGRAAVHKTYQRQRRAASLFSSKTLKSKRQSHCLLLNNGAFNIFQEANSSEIAMPCRKHREIQPAVG